MVIETNEKVKGLRVTKKNKKKHTQRSHLGKSFNNFFKVRGLRLGKKKKIEAKSNLLLPRNTLILKLGFLGRQKKKQP